MRVTRNQFMTVAAYVGSFAAAAAVMLALGPLPGAPRFPDNPTYYLTSWGLGMILTACFALYRAHKSKH